MGAFSTAFVWLLLATSFGDAHPDGVDEKVYLHSAQPLHRRTLSHCRAALSEPGFVQRTVDHRHAEVRALKKARGLEHQ